MISPSLRWRLSVTTTALAAVVAVLLVYVLHTNSRKQLETELERALERRCEAVITVLRSHPDDQALQTLLLAETTYPDSPYEFFLQVLDGSGAVVVQSRNLRAIHLEPPVWTGSLTDAPESQTRTIPNPTDPTRRVLSRSERLPTDIGFAGRGPLTAQAAVTLEALEASLHHSLVDACSLVGGGLVFLFAALWFSVGISLRRVSAISKQAATITTMSLKERLPVHASGDELSELSSVLNTMLDGLQRSWTQMEEFTSDAAHQMRTPLTRIRSELDVFLQGAAHLSDDERAQLESMRDELERLTRTCGRLLLLARLDRGALEQELLCDQIDLSETVAELVDQILPLAREEGVRIECGELPRTEIRCSKPLVSEALLNLLYNAVRFTPSGGRVDVFVRRDGANTSVVVSDTGPGISRELQETVFQRFYRGMTPGRDGEDGAGLGLAIVRGIARAHGGHVHAESNATEGASFVLTLPNRR